MDTFEQLVSAAEEVHDALGTGHTENTYHKALMRELSERGVAFGSETTIPINYKGISVGQRRPDMLVDSPDGTIIVELKAGSRSGEAQLVDYQQILGDDENYNIACGVLIRFNDDVEVLKS
jgi:GxxExxY protein